MLTQAEIGRIRADKTKIKIRVQKLFTLIRRGGFSPYKRTAKASVFIER